MAALKHHHQVTAAQAVVSVNDTLAQELRNCGVGGVLVVHHIGELGILTQCGDSLPLYLAEVESSTGDDIMVEVDAAVGYLLDILSCTIFLAKMLIHLLDGGGGGKTAAREFVLIHEVAVVDGTMVCGEKHQIIALTYLTVKDAEKLSQILVKLHIDIVVLFASGTEGMADGIGR